MGTCLIVPPEFPASSSSGSQGQKTPWPALQLASERDAHTDLGQLRSPHVRGAEHSLNSVPCSDVYHMCNLGQDT